MKRRLLPLVAALGLFSVLIPLSATAVFAWAPPGIASVCSSDQATHNWTITLASESNYSIQWADNSSFTSATTVTMHVGANSLSTPATVTTLYVRWSSDHNSKSSAAWTGGACSTPTPPQTFRLSTSTPAPTRTPCDVDVTEPDVFSHATPCATPTVPPTLKPTQTPAPTATPFQVFQGETATPTDPATPFQSFQGATSVVSTATPPSTSTGSDGQGGTSSPLFALLISLAFGGFGLRSAKVNPCAEGSASDRARDCSDPLRAPRSGALSAARTFPRLAARAAASGRPP
jgi:outer membrane biosynthesis protein TonB